MSGEGDVATVGARRANRLPAELLGKAARWLDENRERAGEETQGKVAAALAAHLGRPVSVANLETAARVAGVRLHGAEDRSLKTAVAALERLATKALVRLNAHDAELARLRKGIEALDARTRPVLPGLDGTGVEREYCQGCGTEIPTESGQLCTECQSKAKGA